MLHPYIVRMTETHVYLRSDKEIKVFVDELLGFCRSRSLKVCWINKLSEFKESTGAWRTERKDLCAINKFLFNNFAVNEASTQASWTESNWKSFPCLQCGKDTKLICGDCNFEWQFQNNSERTTLFQPFEEEEAEVRIVGKKRRRLKQIQTT